MIFPAPGLGLGKREDVQVPFVTSGLGVGVRFLIYIFYLRGAKRMLHWIEGTKRL